MAKKANNPTLVMLVQQLDPAYWSFGSDPSFIEALRQVHAVNASPPGPERIEALRKCAHWLGSGIVASWEADGREITAAHAILHGEDTRQVWDAVSSSYVMEPKPLHIHLLVKFASRAGSASVARLAELAGVAPESIELDKSRGGANVEVRSADRTAA